MGYYLKLIGAMGNIMMMVRKPKKIPLLYYRTGSQQPSIHLFKLDLEC